MDSSVLPFHLLRLPTNSLTAVLRRINLLELVSLSFCSKATKNAVKSINIPSRQIVVAVPKDMFLFYFKVGNECIYLKLCSHIKLVIGILSTYQKITFSPELLKFTRRDYLLHVFDILNNPKVNIVDANEDQRVKEFRELFDGFTINELTTTICELPTEVQTYASWHARHIQISSMGNSGMLSFHQIIFGNFDNLTIQSGRYSFDLLLNANSSIISLGNCKFSKKEVNLFLMHWMFGSAHRNLKRLSSKLSGRIGNIDEHAILKGLQYQQQPESRIRNFTFFNQRLQSVQSVDYNGGCDIRRGDGVEATLFICNTDNTFDFVVWNC